MLVIELFLLILGILSCVISFWTIEIFELLPGFVQQLFFNNSGWGILIGVLKYAGYIGICLLVLNLVSVLRKWWWSRVSIAFIIVYFHYVWGTLI